MLKIATFALPLALVSTMALAQQSSGSMSGGNSMSNGGSMSGQSGMSGNSQTSAQDKRGARRNHAQAGQLTNGSGSPSSTRQDSVSTSPGGKGRNDPTNPAAPGAASGSPQNY